MSKEHRHNFDKCPACGSDMRYESGSSGGISFKNEDCINEDCRFFYGIQGNVTWQGYRPRKGIAELLTQPK